MTSGSTRYYRVSAINSSGVQRYHRLGGRSGSPNWSESNGGRGDGDRSVLQSLQRRRVQLPPRYPTAPTGETSAARTSYTHSRLTSGSTRYYRVSAINSSGVGPASNNANATTDSVDAPGAPTGLRATADGETEIGLSWSSPSSDGGSRITGYRIEVSDDGSNWRDLEADTRSAKTSYTHSRLTSGSTRYYRVSAINSSGVGPASNNANATTDSVDAPGAPTGLRATAAGETEIGLSWSSPSSDGGSRITGYRIEVSDDGSNWRDLEADTRSAKTSYTHSRLTGGSTRYYRVSAINSSGVGPASNNANATTDSVDAPGAPTGLRATADGETEIGLSWSSPSSDGGSRITGYRIEVSDDGSNWRDLEADTRSAKTSYTHSRLTGGSTRYYRVSAINSAGTGPHSNTANATTESPPVCDGYKNDLLGAILKGVPRIVQCVVDEGANVDAKDSDGYPMLYWAITRNKPVEISRILVDAGANVDAKDSDGYPMLYWAITRDNPEIVRILVDAGADVNAKTSGGDPPLTVAKRRGNDVIIKILEDAGATEE